MRPSHPTAMMAPVTTACHRCQKAKRQDQDHHFINKRAPECRPDTRPLCPAKICWPHLAVMGSLL